MEVILKKDIPNVGEEFEVIKVSLGYARNYLLPNKLAIEATKTALAALEKKRSEIEQKQTEKKAAFEAMAKDLADKEFVILADAGPEGKLFGAVTSSVIAEALLDQAKVEIDKRKIHLAESIKLVGDYQVAIKLFQDVNAHIKIKVEAKKQG